MKNVEHKGVITAGRATRYMGTAAVLCYTHDGGGASLVVAASPHSWAVLLQARKLQTRRSRGRCHSCTACFMEKTMSRQCCESVLHPSTWCTNLARPSAVVMGRLGCARRAVKSGVSCSFA